MWIAGSARSALKKLLGLPFENFELIKIPNEKKLIKINIHSAGFLNGNSQALGIAFASSGLDLDITNNLEIWTVVSLEKSTDQTKKLNIIPGYGVGIFQKTSEICISNFAKELLTENLLDIVPKGCKLNLEIAFPNGKFLAERTSNKSFGIVEGLSIIGTTAETYSSASPEQLKNAKIQLNKIVKNNFEGKLVFVIGENGLNLAKDYDIKFPVIKVGNWLGPLLVESALKGVKTVILLGYHGKLIKLAGGIFHTHNHLADARIEILVYLALKEKVPIEIISKFSQSDTIEDALFTIEVFNKSLAKKLLDKISNTIEERSFSYINRYVTSDIEIAALIFDKQRQIRSAGINGKKFINLFQCD